MNGRNTPEAPKLDHCDTCGASSIDGNGPISTLHGIQLCADCKQGALDLVAEDPATWQFGPDGRLRRTTPDPHTERAKTQVAALRDAVTAHLHGPDVEVFHPQAGIAIILPNGYRWHVYIPHRGISSTDQHHAVLFTPAREIVPGLPIVVISDVSDIRQFVTICTTPGNHLYQAIDDDVLARTEIALFDPEVLLPPEQP
jgi:hypothetical protein